jgi:hypothetical protein
MKKHMKLFLLCLFLISITFAYFSTSNLLSSKNKKNSDNIYQYSKEELEIINNYIDEMVLVKNYRSDRKKYSFKIGKFEVTQELYKAVMGINPSYYSKDPSEGEIQDKRPVEFVSWYDAVYFCNVLTTLTMGEDECCYTITDIVRKNDNQEAQKNKFIKEKPTFITFIKSANVIIDHNKKGFRLPTKDEWIYAAKGGHKSKKSKYAGSNNLQEVGWVKYNSNKTHHQVGLLKPNKLGIYDMTGNVKEFCEDLAFYTNTKNQVFPRRIEIGGNMFSDKDQALLTYFEAGLEYPGNGGQGFRIICQESK